MGNYENTHVINNQSLTSKPLPHFAKYFIFRIGALGQKRGSNTPSIHILRLLHPQKKRVRSDARGGDISCMVYFEAASGAKKCHRRDAREDGLMGGAGLRI